MELSNQQLRAMARENGEAMFWPSTPCRRGHLCERRVDNSCCVECLRITAKVRSRKQPRSGKPRGDAAWREAKAQGLKRYSTGKPCRKGHVSERFVGNRNCIECFNAMRTVLQEKTKAANRLAGKRILGAMTKAVERGETKYFTGRPCPRGHIDWRSVVNSSCYACNRERTKRRAKENPEYFWLAAKIRGHAIRQARPKWADKNKIKEIYANCPDGFQVDHIVPLKGKLVCGLHVEHNLRYLPAQLNNEKNNRFHPIVEQGGQQVLVYV